MKIRFFISVLLVLFGIFYFTADGAAGLKIDSVYPAKGINGKDLPVTITGSGFDANTRASMYPGSALIGATNTPDFIFNISVSGSFAYIAGDTGLHIVDVSDPKNPKIIGSAGMLAVDISVSGSFAYVSTGTGLQVIDISDPKNPKIIGESAISGYGITYGIAVSGSAAYLTSENGGLYVIDISDPKNPKIIGAVNMPYQAKGIAVSGSMAYVTVGDRASNSSLQVIDISNPKNPKIVGAMETGYALGVSISGSAAYLIDDYGLQAIDVSDPNNPKKIGLLNISDVRYYNLTVSGSKVYLTSGSGKLLVIDISNPKNPVIIGTIGADGYNAAIVGNNALICTYDRLIIVPLPVEVKPTLINDTTISVTLPSPSVPGNYTIRVFNNNGEASELIGAVTFDSAGITTPEDRGSIAVGEDLSLNLCARYRGQTFGLTMNFSPNPHGLSGVFWKADPATLKQIESSSPACIDIGDDLSLNIRAEYHGIGYAFPMSFYPYPDAASASEFFWKADPVSLRVIY